MKERISQINLSIEEKKIHLINQVEQHFTAIRVTSSFDESQSKVIQNSKSAPPLTYILYAIAGLSAIGAIATESKVLCLGVAAASAIGGYKLSQNANAITTNKPSHSTNIAAIKNIITTKVLESVKKTTNEWEEFMETNQKEIQNLISSSALDSNKKDYLYSLVFLYEVIDISISEFSSMISSSANTADINQALIKYKSKFISAIEAAASKQIAKYNLLLETI